MINYRHIFEAMLEHEDTLHVGKPITNTYRRLSEVPAEIKESKATSQELKKREFNFVGLTICYTFMEATELVNDYLIHCFRYTQLQSLK